MKSVIVFDYLTKRVETCKADHLPPHQTIASIDIPRSSFMAAVTVYIKTGLPPNHILNRDEVHLHLYELPLSDRMLRQIGLEENKLYILNVPQWETNEAVLSPLTTKSRPTKSNAVTRPSSSAEATPSSSSTMPENETLSQSSTLASNGSAFHGLPSAIPTFRNQTLEDAWNMTSDRDLEDLLRHGATTVRVEVIALSKAQWMSNEGFQGFRGRVVDVLEKR